MNPNTLTGPALLGEEDRRFFQDLALLGERPDLTPQPAKLLALVAAEPLTAALIDVDLTGPIAQRLRRDPELGGELRDRPAAASEQPDGLLAELQRIRRWHEH